MAGRKTTRKRRVRKNVESGVAHIHSTFNNTLVMITDLAAMRSLGPLLVHSALKAVVSRRLLLRRWLLKLLQRNQWNMA